MIIDIKNKNKNTMKIFNIFKKLIFSLNTYNDYKYELLLIYYKIEENDIKFVIYYETGRKKDILLMKNIRFSSDLDLKNIINKDYDSIFLKKEELNDFLIRLKNVDLKSISFDKDNITIDKKYSYQKRNSYQLSTLLSNNYQIFSIKDAKNKVDEEINEKIRKKFKDKEEYKAFYKANNKNNKYVNVYKKFFTKALTYEDLYVDKLMKKIERFYTIYNNFILISFKKYDIYMQYNDVMEKDKKNDK